MKGSDRIILIALPLVALTAAFWFLGLSPKREEAGELQERIESLNSSIAAAEDQIASAEAARDAFPRNYGTMVKLGRAVPEDGDQSTLIFDLAEMAGESKVKFRDFQLLSGGTGAEAAVETAPTTSTSGEDEDSEDSGSEAPGNAVSEEATPAAATPAPATEATAANLPIGATVGAAGLPTMPYEFKFIGGFFNVADFFADLDDRVEVAARGPRVSGRLVTIDGFALTGDQMKGFPSVEANFAVTSYLVPAEQGLTVGANPAGPSPATPADPVTVSTPAPAAGVTP